MNRQPNCDVCEWATSSIKAFDMNLCTDDYETLTLVAAMERDRIVAILEDCGWLPDRPIVALIKGEQND